MLIFDRETGELASREPNLLCSFGVVEVLGGLIASAFIEVGVGAATAGIIGTGLAGGVIGAGFGALGGAITGGDPGRGALFGGLSGGLLSGGGALASNLGVFGGAGGAAGGLGGVGADTGATFADTLVPQTTGTLGGANAFIDSGAFDVAGGSALGGLGGAGGSVFDTSSALGNAAPAAEAVQPQTAFAPGVTSGSGEALPGIGVNNPLNTLQTAGVGVPGAGPGASAFAPPSGVPLDATSAASLSGHAGLVADGSNAIGLDVASQGGAQGTASALGAGADTGATWADTLTPATTATTTGGPIDSGVFDVAGGSGSGSSALGGIGDTLKGGLKSVTDFVGSPVGKAAGLGLNALTLGKDLLAPQQIPGLQQLTTAANTQAQLGSQLLSQGGAERGAPIAAATNLAGGAATQGQALSSYLTNGTLPPGVQGSIDQATKDAITAIKAQYAQRGMAGSTAETQDINSAKQRAVSQGANIAIGLLQQGTSLEQLSSQIYSNLVGQGTSLIQAGANLSGVSTNSLTGVLNANIAQNNATNQAIANLSRALAGGSVTNTGTQAAA